MEELVEQAQAINPSLQARVFINRASPHPQVREAEEAEEILDEFEHLIFSEVVIHDRIAFRRAASGGIAVTEADSPDPKACREVQELYDAIFEQTKTDYAQEA
jgi:cellulose biosynthesis protein BcsQ